MTSPATPNSSPFLKPVRSLSITSSITSVPTSPTLKVFSESSISRAQANTSTYVPAPSPTPINLDKKFLEEIESTLQYSHATFDSDSNEHLIEVAELLLLRIYPGLTIQIRVEDPSIVKICQLHKSCSDLITRIIEKISDDDRRHLRTLAMNQFPEKMLEISQNTQNAHVAVADFITNLHPFTRDLFLYIYMNDVEFSDNLETLQESIKNTPHFTTDEKGTRFSPSFITVCSTLHRVSLI